MTLRSAFAHDLPIAAKLNAVIVVAIAVVLGTAGIVLTVWLTKQLEERSLAELERTNRQVVDMIDAYSVALERSAEMLGAQFQATLPRRVNFEAANGNLALVDAFTDATGGVATVFERRGDDFVRVATSLKKENGERALGTTLGSKHPAYAKIMAGEPYTGRAALFGRDYMTRYLPLKDEAGQVTGIAFVGVDFTEGMKILKQKVLGLKVGETGYVFALDAVREPGLAAIHPAAEGKNLSGAKDANGRLFVKEMLGMKHGVIRYDWANKERGETVSREKVAVIDAFEKWGWIIGSGSYLDEFVRDVRWVLIQFAATGLVAAAALVAAVFFATRHWVSRPLGEALAVTRRVAAGDLTVSIDARGGDEVGQLLTATNDMCGQLRGMIGEVNGGIDSLAAGVGQLATAAQEVAEASGEQSAAAGAMAAAVEEMTTSIDVVSSNAHDARTMAETSGEISGSGAAVIDSAIRGMGGIAATVRESSGVVEQLGEQSRQISGIVSVIREIADQTNLLALNAAIEAARAGEQGRGFAVVADEVRKLAERTAQSTEEITTMVEQIQAGAGNAVESMAVGVQQVEEGVELANKAGASIAEIKTGAASVDSAVAGISQALREQTVAAQDIAANVARIAEQAERNHSRAQQTSATASDMEALAERLSQSIARFRTA